jgi:hypothetical protein
MDRAELFVHGTNSNDFKFQEYIKLVEYFAIHQEGWAGCKPG